MAGAEPDCLCAALPVWSSSGRRTYPSASRMHGSRRSCRWCWVPMKSCAFSKRYRAWSLVPRWPRPMPLDCVLPKLRASRSATSTAAGWSSASSRARETATATSCCRRNCSDPAFLLATGATRALAVSRAWSRASDQRNRAACCLLLGMCCVGAGQACHRAHAAS